MEGIPTLLGRGEGWCQAGHPQDRPARLVCSKLSIVPMPRARNPVQTKQSQKPGSYSGATWEGVGR